MLFFSSYRSIARIFKWLTLVLFAYVITAFLARPDWLSVLSATVFPRVEWSSRFFATFVGILGTTISPYLFFWQASQEVEDRRAKAKLVGDECEAASDEELRAARTDVLSGMFFSNLVMYFIILTTAATLNARGQTDIETAQQAAEALRPLAGSGAYLLFTLGLVGTGMLAVPVLSGSAAYAVAEAESWRGSLDDRPRLAPRFFAVVTASMLLGLALDYVGFNAVKMLFYSAVLNGILAPPLIVLVVLLTSNPKVMGNRTSSRSLRYLGWATALIMTAAAVGMFVTM
jgi:Mn2+/Fe2+ NRAMP family transporter